MNVFLSDKLRIISFISIVLVVLLHSYNLNVPLLDINSYQANFYNLFIQNFFVEGVARVAVPILFLISGYLFFLKIRAVDFSFVVQNKNRLKTILIPYLFWSIWGLFLHFVLQHISFSRQFFVNDLVTDYSLLQLIDTLFLHPLPYQLWFLRDLMVLSLISPILFYAIKRLKIIFLFLLLLIWLNLFSFRFVVFAKDSILFFSIGAYFAIFNIDVVLKMMSRFLSLKFFLLWLVVLLLRSYFISVCDVFSLVNQFLQKINIIIGVIAMWGMYDLLSLEFNPLQAIFCKLSGYSFFIYAFHEPLLKIIKKGLIYINGNIDAFSLLNFFLAPLLVIVISIFGAHFLKRIMPKFYLIITGGR